jgi:chemotaxis protein MotB
VAVSAGFSVLAMTGCVTKGTYETVVSEYQQSTDRNAALTKVNNAQKANIRLLRNRISDIESQAAKLGFQLAETSNELNQASKDLEQTETALGQTKSKLSDREQALLDMNDRLQSTNKALEQKLAELETKDSMLHKTEEELRKASEYMNRTDKLYQDLVGELKGELDAKQIKIKEMKDGIDVNLSEEILFPSGSAVLNQSGKQVIAKLAERFRGKEYQIMVAGFTDNVPISGRLAKVYPSNWELAGARAASVVRLLESSGINSDYLLATSFAENQPVAANTTAEGRSLNRRIEIRLRPLQ